MGPMFLLFDIIIFLEVLVHNCELVVLEKVMKNASHYWYTGTGSIRRDWLWENHSASSIHFGGRDSIFTWSQLQHNLYATSSYICHICCSSNILWKGWKSRRNCRLPDPAGVKAVCWNKVIVLYDRGAAASTGIWILVQC